MTPLKIAMISYRLPMRGEKRGGIERVAHVLADGLAKRGHAVVVFSHDPKPAGAAYDVRMLPWKPFVETWAGLRMTAGYLGNVLALRIDLREFDVVIAHGDSLLLSMGRTPVVRVMHGSAKGEALHAASIGRAILQWGVYVQELLTAFVSPSTVVGVSANTQRDNPFVRHIIPHGVDTAVFQPIPIGKSAHPTIVFVGAAEGRKRGRFLLELFEREVRRVHPDAELTFVGPRGPSQAGVNYVTGVSDVDLAALYRRAWVCAAPSTYEGFGLPYLEAMACGTALIATPNSGSREVLGERYNGLVTDAEFAPAVLNVLADEHRRRSLEVAGIERAAAFSINRTIDQYEALLHGLRGMHARSVASV
ncbi:MAG TPA: glycosyltransferase family 4 protein [Vicinamibacterales bacterium]|nr:glycosyltransferase family 4 protein [Vicinamibacterales bacterium]